MKTIQQSLLLISFMLVSTLFAQAQRAEFPYSNRLSVQTGLLQDLALRGQNITVMYTTRRMVYEWSHGNSLDPDGSSGGLLGGNEAYVNQKLAVHIPWSTGPSIGYRITPFLNVRAEFKAHRYEVNYDKPTSVEFNQGPIVKYTAFEVGAGIFYEYYPFRKKANWTKGILIEPVVRYWPRVGSTLDKDFTYQNSQTGRTESLPAYQNGFLANVNIGYTFGSGKR